jgi:pimeloyl-ACP methyl ester carboxylesterase
VEEIDLVTGDGRRLHAYSAGSGPLTVMWHHGTPNIGTPPAPLFPAADRLGVRFLGYDRPGYGGSTPRPGRDIASAAGDAAAVADAFGVRQFAVFGHSGGGPHALACAALLADRVPVAVSVSGLAPYGAEGLDWFAGMGPSSEASLRAAVAGRDAKEADALIEAEPDFIAADWAALEAEWGWFGSVVAPAMAAGPGPLIDDDLAYVAPWGFDPASVRARTLLIHGAADRMVPSSHSAWLAGHITGAEARIVAGEGHVSVLAPAAVPALEWLAAAVAADSTEPNAAR